MDIDKERLAFVERVAVSLDRILFIQNGIADQYSELYGYYRDNGISSHIIDKHLMEAKQHLNNIKLTHLLIKGTLEETP